MLWLAGFSSDGDALRHWLLQVQLCLCPLRINCIFSRASLRSGSASFSSCAVFKQEGCTRTMTREDEEEKTSSHGAAESSFSHFVWWPLLPP